jgi:hypothetical protein
MADASSPPPSPPPISPSPPPLLLSKFQTPAAVLQNYKTIVLQTKFPFLKCLQHVSNVYHYRIFMQHTHRVNLQLKFELPTEFSECLLWVEYVSNWANVFFSYTILVFVAKNVAGHREWKIWFLIKSKINSKTLVVRKKFLSRGSTFVKETNCWSDIENLVYASQKLI